MPTYRLTVEYDGTRFHGWQGQAAARTASGEILRAAADFCEILDFGGAGRTDSGVHALAQVAHLRLKKSVEPESFRRDLNDRLPQDIHVLTVALAAERFHARHHAISRSYIYQLSRRRSAFGKRFIWWVRDPLDRAEMARAAELFVGRHDFSRFCERPAEQTSTLVEVERVEVADHGDLTLVRLVASHFLWKMVRRVVGTLVRVGAGQLKADDLKQLLDPRRPIAPTASPAQWTAPASGLFLERVLYEGDPPLAALLPAMPVRSVGDEPPLKRRPVPAQRTVPGQRTPPPQRTSPAQRTAHTAKHFGKGPTRKRR